MTTPDERDDDAIDERYRRASSAAPAAPSDAVRAAILAEGRRVAAERRRAVAPAQFDTGRPAANDRHWTLAAAGSLAAAVIAGLIVVPLYRESSVSPERTPAATEASPGAARRSEGAIAPTAPADAAPDHESGPPMPLSRPRPSPEAYLPRAAAPPPPTVAAEGRRDPRVDALAVPENEVLGGVPEAQRHLAATDRAVADAASSLAPRSAGAAAAMAPAARLAAKAAPMSALGGEAAALRAAVQGGDAARVDGLLAHGAAVDAPGEDGQTPLLLAISGGQADVVRVLLARGADPNAVGRDGRTPLAEARARQRDDIAALLLQSGAR